MYKKIIVKMTLMLCIGLSIIACNDDNLQEQTLPLLGRMVIRGYAQNDTIQIKEDDVLVSSYANHEDRTEFTKTVRVETEFAYHDGIPRNIELLSYRDGTQTSLKTYSINPPEAPSEELRDFFSKSDTITFFLASGIFLDDVLQHSPGVLTNPDNVGYKFMFPTMNRISQSGYEGTLDAIITSFRGQELGVVENIETDTFSSFIELPYGAPPFVYIELVKHGTTESYISGKTIKIRKIIKKNTSGLIILDEVANDDGSFKEVSTSIDLTTYFDY